MQTQNCSCFDDHSKTEWLFGRCICAADLEKGTIAKLNTNTSIFTGPAETTRCVCSYSRYPGCLRAVSYALSITLESWAVFNVPWAEQRLGTPSCCPISGNVPFPAPGIALGLSLYQLSVTIATPHLTSPCTKNRSPWSQGKKTKGNQKGQWQQEL